MTYDKEFEKWYKTALIGRESWKDDAHDEMFIAWQAARKDHYRIGEEVEAQQIGAQWKKGTVMAVVYSNNNYYIEEPELVRRIPLKSRIDEIAEEAASNWAGGKKALEDAIKAAILQSLKEIQ